MRPYMLDRFAFLGLPAPVRRAAVKPLVARPWASPHAAHEDVLSPLSRREALEHQA
ncbi:conserved hypothetical protein [Ricinus communis]|uniref:Uncharacterized protein n=1 Tax=Ricinus communis TaxID=3988 RepID=B9TK41_RICCO|nr:conserved hypothetical protein [Ricinus communis]